LLSLLVLWGCEDPSDAKLISTFRLHQKDLETLVAMSDEDARFVRIAPGFAKTDNGSWAGSQSKGGLTPERWDEYRRLFAEAGLSGGLNRRYRNEVFLLANTEGIVGHGTALGYVYCGEPLPLGS
jgi:hypothetical protein